MTWHYNPKTRKAIGDHAEMLFEKQVRCSCGGQFSFIGDSYPGCPDYTCEYCGQLADVKSSPQSDKTGNIAVSAIPWENYPDDLLLATIVNGQWVAEYKRNIRVSNQRPFDSTHSGTKFHLVACRQFRSISELGFKVVS